MEALTVEDHAIYTTAVKLLRGLAPLLELHDIFERAPLRALEVATAIGDQVWIAEIIPLLRHETAGVRSRATEALGLLGVSAQTLHPGLKDASSLVRAATYRALAELGDLEPLEQAAHTEQDPVAKVALVDILHPKGMWP